MMSNNYVSNELGILPNYINGEFVYSKSSDLLPIYNPAFDEVIGYVPNSTDEEIDAAVEAALQGFEQMRKLPPSDRVKLLLKLRELIIANSDVLARALVNNHGRTYDEAVGEIKRTLENIEAAASIAYTLAKGELMINIETGIIDEYLIREPLGAFAILTPFNIPLHAWSSFIPYAIALGASTVLKPSEITPLVVYEVSKLMKQAGIPKGAVNIIHGGPTVGEKLARHKDIVGIGFIGSTRVARKLYEIAGQEGKRASLNAGSKNVTVVMPDADMEKTVQAIISSYFGMSGQRCFAGSILAPVGKARDFIVNAFVEKASKIRLGYGLQNDVDMGPLAYRAHQQRVLNYIGRGEEDGGRLLLDGRQNKTYGDLKGYFVGPTIFTDIPESSPVHKDDIFGPVATIHPVDTLDEAIDLINNKTIYGHTAVIFTSNPKVARDFTLSVNVGHVGINIGIPQPISYFPLGGRKQSFFGGAHSRFDTLRFFTDHKIVVSRWW
jgi:malonate-semialdehyde dehydrogenase (acetylating)/methylmalonate-semialdehyde dehydrogenase